jgi:uncharacterized protein YgiM (DUF1202 family)
MNSHSFLILTAAGLMAAAPALAQVSATAATDLNMRAGPGSTQQVLGVIPSAGEVTVFGCQEVGNWCQVDFQGNQGWVHGSYLNAVTAERQVVVIGDREALALADTSAQGPDDATRAAGGLVGGAAGAYIASAMIGGPAAIIVGGLLGSALGSSDVSPAVSYAQANPVQPMSMGGEVIVGAGIPAGVEIVTVPGTNYGYLNANGSPVIVDLESRRIVEIVR